MNQQTCDKVEQRSSASLNEIYAQMGQQTARSVIHQQIENLKATGKVLILSEEEERLLASFRRFKATCKKAGEVFKWQTKPDKEVVIEAPQRVLIYDPAEVVNETQ